MNSFSWLCALSATVSTLAAADQDTPSIFQMREVLEQPATNSEQVVLMHPPRNNGQQFKELLNISKAPLMTDSAVKNAKVGADPLTGRPQVEVNFTEQGRKQFADVTRTNVNRRLAILVNGKVLIAPIIRTEINTGQALIAGDFSKDEAQKIADTINGVVAEDGKSKFVPWTHGLYDKRLDVKPPGPRDR